MNFAYQPLLIYCSAAMFVIVNGQSTTDDEIGRDEISQLKDRIAMLEHQLRDNCQTTAASKLRTSRFEQHALLLLRTFLAYLRFVFKLRLWLSHNHFSLIITIHQTGILPLDAMRKRGLCCRPVSVRPSVRHVGGRQTSCSAQ